MKVVIHAAYGSTKDVAVYSGLGVQANAIFVIGGKSKRNAEKLATVRCTSGSIVVVFPGNEWKRVLRHSRIIK